MWLRSGRRRRSFRARRGFAPNESDRLTQEPPGETRRGALAVVVVGPVTRPGADGARGATALRPRSARECLSGDLRPVGDEGPHPHRSARTPGPRSSRCRSGAVAVAPALMHRPSSLPHRETGPPVPEWARLSSRARPTRSRERCVGRARSTLPYPSGMYSVCRPGRSAIFTASSSTVP